MFGGLRKVSDRITIAAALALTLGIYAMHAIPAKAADLGGDCCADLEERVANLEATTVTKSTKKVTVSISGWMIKSFNSWSDGKMQNQYVGDKDADLASRFVISGTAQIAPGWSAGYNMTIVAPGNVFGILSNQYDQNSSLDSSISTLYSYMYIKSDKYGTVSWGKVSPASDNAAVLADISGSVIESNAVWFEGPGFYLRAKGSHGFGQTLSGLTWGDFLQCYSIGAGIGADCNGAPYDAVLYTSPTIGGFSLQASWGQDDIGDLAVFYNGTWGNFKTSVAYSYTHTSPHQTGYGLGVSDDLNQVGATIMHVPSGLGVYGEYINEHLNTSGPGTSTDVFYVKPFIKRKVVALGDTTFYGEYGRYNNQMAGMANQNLCNVWVGFRNGGFSNGGLGNAGVCRDNTHQFGPWTVQDDITATGSTAERWGLGVVQNIDSAGMSVFARWQHENMSVNLHDWYTDQKVHQGFYGFDLFQVGGIIFF